jgi:hypothetical protein
LPRYRQILDTGAALRANRLRVELHDLKNVVRHFGAYRQAKLLCGCAKSGKSCVHVPVESFSASASGFSTAQSVAINSQVMIGG